MAGGLRLRINLFLALALALNVGFWYGAHETFAHWGGVPPVPTKNGARIMTLGDEQFSHRFGAITLQNLGNSGGRVTAVKDYDYKKLGEWFWLLHDLDPASNHVPMLAAYYFGATQKPEDLAVVVNYLGAIGQNPVANKWRWLAQAIFWPATGWMICRWRWIWPMRSAACNLWVMSCPDGHGKCLPLFWRSRVKNNPRAS